MLFDKTNFIFPFFLFTNSRNFAIDFNENVSFLKNADLEFFSKVCR